jgi:hypothetical protein
MERTASSGVDFARGITAGGAALAGDAARYDLSKAVNEVRAFSSQNYLDTSMANFGASGGFGSNRNQVFSTMQKSLPQMAGMGMSASDMQGLYQTGLGAGDIFTRGGASGMQSTIMNAANVQKSGVTSAQDYMSRIAQIGNSGGSEKNIEDILANAVSRGVDDAKSFGDVVDAISNMSSAGAANGIDITGTTARMMMAGMDAAKGNGLSNKLNINSTMKQAGAINEITSDDALNFSNVAEQGLLSSGKLSDVSQMGRAAIAQRSAAEIAELQSVLKSGNKNKLKSMAERMPGALETLYDQEGNLRSDAGERLEEIGSIKKGKIAGHLASFESENMKVGKVRKALDSGDYDSLSTEEKSRLSDLGINREGLAGISGKGFGKKGLPEQKGEATGAQQILNAKAEGQANIFSNGEKFTKGLEELGRNMSSLSKTIDAQASASRAANSAGTMKLDASAFENGVAGFNQAVDKLLTKLGEDPRNSQGFSSTNRPSQTSQSSSAGEKSLWDSFVEMGSKINFGGGMK